MTDRVNRAHKIGRWACIDLRSIIYIIPPFRKSDSLKKKKKKKIYFFILLKPKSQTGLQIKALTNT